MGENELWGKDVNRFIAIANKHNVKMLMVGGLAVAHFGFRRSSADIDFWIKTTKKNFENLVNVFNEMGYEIKEFPESVIKGQQNISLSFSPFDLDLQLLTNFSSTMKFEEAYKKSECIESSNGNNLMRWNVLSYEDLISSKIKSGRIKDLMDVEKLQEIRKITVEKNHVEIAANFHLSNKYFGKTKGILTIRFLPFLNIALNKNFGFKLKKEKLKDLILEIKKKDIIS
ncbi:MAG: DUF6036 family nucleotidyltransferase [Polaribacter sp.]